MNFSRCEWDENVKGDLLEFLKIANDRKTSEFCNINEYNRLKSLFPLSKSIKDELRTYKPNICIDITESDNEEINQNPQTYDALLEHNCDNADCLELADTIKDSLVVEKAVSRQLLNDLLNLDNTKLEKYFRYFVKELTLEDVQNLWTSMTNNHIMAEHIVTIFISILFLPKLKQEFVYEMQEVFLRLSQQHGLVLRSELVKHFMQVSQDTETPNALVQYVILLNDEYKTEILREFISTAEKLHPNYIPIIESLINSRTDVDILKKLIEFMASSSMEFSSDNAYGKLLFKAVSSCDRNLPELEQPLKRFLGVHKSIWRIKVEKVISSWFNDSLTQSFM